MVSPRNRSPARTSSCLHSCARHWNNSRWVNELCCGVYLDSNGNASRTNIDTANIVDSWKWSPTSERSYCSRSLTLHCILYGDRNPQVNFKVTDDEWKMERSCFSKKTLLSSFSPISCLLHPRSFISIRIALFPSSLSLSLSLSHP